MREKLPRGRRVAWICPKCQYRVFLSADWPEGTKPACAYHGRMERQINKPYVGKPVKA